MAATGKSFLRKIDISDVEPGMVLEDVFNNEGVLLISSQVEVTSFEQIEVLKKRGCLRCLYKHPGWNRCSD